MYADHEQQAVFHAVDEYPRESCGVVVDGQYRRMRNVHPEPTKSFEMDSKEYSEMLLTGKVTGVVHSHPDGPPWPTRSDMVTQARTRIPWAIITVEKLLDGVGVTDLFWFGLDDRPPLLRRGFRHGVTDCYALIRDYYQQRLDVDLPDFPREWEWWKHGERLYEDNIEKSGFTRIEKAHNKDPQVGDIFFAQIRSKTPNHAGVYTGHGTMIHHLTGTSGYAPAHLSAEEPYGRYDPYVQFWARFQG